MNVRRLIGLSLQPTLPAGRDSITILIPVVHHSKIGRSTSGHNPNCRPTGLCQLCPPAEMRSKGLKTGEGGLATKSTAENFAFIRSPRQRGQAAEAGT